MSRLLLVKTSSLGDVVHNLPVVTDLKLRYPELRIDWAVEESFADIPALHPGVDTVIPVALRRWRRRLFSPATWQEIGACRARLRATGYDCILDTQGLVKSAVVACQARGPRHGQDGASAREPLAALFYQHRHAIPRGQHAVTRNRALAAAAFGYALPPTPPDYGVQAQPQPALELPARYVVALHATSRDSKLWPLQHWIELGRHLAMQGIDLVLPWGSEDERTRAGAIAASVPQAMVLPRLPLRELAAVIAHGQGAIGVDTGLIHLAAALHKPTVAIYTDTDPGLTGVLGPDAARFRNLGGIGQIPPHQEVSAALALVMG